MNQPIICIHEAILRNEAFEEDISLLTSVIGGYLSQTSVYRTIQSSCIWEGRGRIDDTSETYSLLVVRRQ